MNNIYVIYMYTCIHTYIYIYTIISKKHTKYTL